MTQKLVLTDDLDGTDGAETITYTLDGQEYEIDLSVEGLPDWRRFAASAAARPR